MKIFFTLSLGIIFFSCQDKIHHKLKDNYQYDDRKVGEASAGYFIEYPSEQGDYTSDNITYIPNLTMEYDYYYQKGNRKFKFAVKDTAHGDIMGKGWDFIAYDNFQNKDKKCEKLKLIVTDDRKRFGPKYNQTVIQYHYLNARGEIIYDEHTGVIENSKNIWLHPPRQKLFRAFIPVPWPYICTPYSIGTKCSYQSDWADFLSDDRIVKWNGTLNNTYQYEITGIENYQLADTIIECFEIRGSAISDLGEATAVYLFHPNFGFLSYDITLQNGDQLTLWATKVLHPISENAKVESQ